MGNFDHAHAFTAKWEGGISDHPADRGGYTAYGVCEEFLKDFAKRNRDFLHEIGVSLPVCRANMKKITRSVAAQILGREFWVGLDAMAEPCATVTYDASVNHGRLRGVKLTQQAANLVTGAKIAVDGVTGPKTREACALAPLAVALKAVELRENFFRNIVKNNPSQKVFLKGWLNRAADLRRYIS